MRFSKLLAAGIVFTTATVALAQTPDYPNIGRAATKEETQAWDISIGPDGKGLPEGHGTAKEGAPIFAEKCAVCHGAQGEGGKIGPRVVGGIADTETLTTLHPTRSVGGYWPYATTVWDFIRRAMPRGQSGTLTPNEVYALTAFILFKSNIIQEGDVLDAKTLPKVQMPNRNGFVPAKFEDIPDEKKRGCKQGVCP
ncbi:MAG TPA: cytochrome c [Candidatus Acidoferrales bacterium]|nr:cytochrome c [Candidatus Acidoferrales bacterium]